MILLNAYISNANPPRTRSIRYVNLTPACNVLTTSMLSGYQNNPPAIEFMGKKLGRWGRTYGALLQPPWALRPENNCTSCMPLAMPVAGVAPQVRQTMRQYPEFKDIGKRMLAAWSEGLQGLRPQRVDAEGAWAKDDVFEGFSEPPELETRRLTIGRSPLLANR